MHTQQDIPRDHFINLEARVERRKRYPIPTASQVFQKLHTGPHDARLMELFRQKREDLDSLRALRK